MNQDPDELTEDEEFDTPGVQRVERDYNADALSMLEGLEAVRRRP